MKIVHVVMGKANPFRMNGVNKAAHYLSLFQYRLGLDIELWGITEKPDAITPPREYLLRLFKASRNRFKLDNSLKVAIQALQINTIVHFHGVIIPEFYCLSRKLRERGVRWIISPHGAYSPTALCRSKYRKKLYFFLFEKKFLGQASAVHTLTPMEKKWVQAIYPAKCIHIIPNGEDRENINFTFKDIQCADRPVFGFCGRLDCHIKGLDILLQGFKLYSDNGGRGSLWMIGDGPSRRMLEEYVSSNDLVKKVRFFGPLFNDNKFNHIANMDVFVHTSRSEGLSYSLLEAAALAKPLLISEGTNMGSEICQWNCGIVLPENTPTHVAEAMKEFERLKNSNMLAIYGDNATRMIEEKYSNRIVSKRLIDEVYKELIG